MKRIILAFVLLLFAILSGVLSLFVTNKICSDMITSVNAVIDSLSSNGIELSEKTAELTRKWEKSVKPLTLFAGQKNTAEITSRLQSVVFHIEKGDEDAAILSCQECKELLTNIIIINSPSLLSLEKQKFTQKQNNIF